MPRQEQFDRAPQGRAGDKIPTQAGAPSATTLIYAIGAGITAAAGTRLALQLFIDKGFELFSFRLPGFVSPVSVILSLPPRVRIG